MYKGPEAYLSVSDFSQNSLEVSDFEVFSVSVSFIGCKPAIERMNFIGRGLSVTNDIPYLNFIGIGYRFIDNQDFLSESGVCFTRAEDINIPF